MLKRYVTLGVYDMSKGWKQIENMVAAAPGTPLELRVADDLWAGLILLVDPIFENSLQTVTTAENIKGIMGRSLGMNITIEKMLRLHTDMYELPSMHYLFFYEQSTLVGQSYTVVADTQPDLLDLVNI